MENKARLTPMVKVLTDLRNQGFTLDFKVTDDSRMCTMDGKECFAPDEVRIVNFYRFEGESNPGDMAILYVLETKSGAKGTVSDAYGPYADSTVESFMKKVEDLGKNLDKQSL